RKVFVDLHRQGLIYRDQRLVNWDPKLQTAISDLEVQNPEVKGHLWRIRYPLKDEPGRYVTIATTRPETLLGDTAVAVHPNDARYKDLVGKIVVLPLVGREIPIISDEYADPETGTGALKITPAHDFNDFEVGRRHNLPRVNIFDRFASINENAPEAYRGLDRFDARKRVVADLEAQGLIEKVEDHVHKVPHGDRGNVPLEPWLTDQWYADAKRLAEPAIKAVEEGCTRFVPEQWTKTYFEWMRNIQPWCISRQLWWGHQIPVWYGRKRADEEWTEETRPYLSENDPEIFVAESEEEAKLQAEKRYGCPVTILKRAPDGYTDEPFQQVLNDELKGQPYREPIWREEDVLDTWFSSALWPFSTLGWPEPTRELARYYPSDVLVTGFDIIFFWVARMMMMGCKFMGDVPFRTVYIHALVRDERGQKMSKTKGNVIDRLELIERFGADALRFTLTALAAQGRDIKLATSRVEGYRNFITKLWNAARYAQMNGCALVAGFDPAGTKLIVNRWIVGALAETNARVAQAIDEYKFNEAAGALDQFIWGTFCDWYLEFTKPILTGNDEATKAETRATTAWVLGETVHLLHPIAPYVTEELWKHFGGSGMLISTPWPSHGLTLIDAEAMAEMN